MEKIGCEQLQEYLEEIISCDAFELHMIRDHGNEESSNPSFYIPYMMNDALECYLLLTNGRMVGEYLPDVSAELSVNYTEGPGVRGLIFKQGTDRVFTLWFEECFRVLNCYRYDQIGHFWVKGQEQWRRLVYIIGTIHDKYHYMGEEVCNEKEKELVPLMHFGPLRRYSPIRESLDEYYEDLPDGLRTMEQLAREAKDEGFLCLLKLYERFPCRRLMNGILARAMGRGQRSDLYQLLFQKVQSASAEYPDRRYPEVLEQMISDSRKKVEQELKKLGFEGEYPLFWRKNLQILAVEEHPFVVMESDSFEFRIQFMVSETAKETGRINEGFFRKKGNRGWIAQSLEFLQH